MYEKCSGRWMGVVVLSIGLTGSEVGAQVEKWQLEPTTAAPIPRESHTMVFHAGEGVTILYGGVDGSGSKSDTWQFGPDGWEFISSGLGPRHGHAQVYDSGRGRVVHFGGESGGSIVSGTWELDDGVWTSVGGSGPLPRTDHAMAYDRDRSETILFGGQDDRFFDDTWAWDGVEWVELAVTGPEERRDHAMVFDPERGEVVLFGGADGNGQFGDTWVWDGVAWTLVSLDGPSARFDHAMVYDEENERVLLFGGRSGGARMNDTWSWDGTAWTLLEGGDAPSAREGHAMAYDLFDTRTVLFGGDEGNPIGDTWIRDTFDTVVTLECGGVTVCPAGSIGYEVDASNVEATPLGLRVRVLAGLGIPDTTQLFATSFTGDVRQVSQIRTPGSLPSVCPTTVTLEAILEDSAGEVVSSDTCAIRFLPAESP